MGFSNPAGVTAGDLERLHLGQAWLYLLTQVESFGQLVRFSLSQRFRCSLSGQTVSRHFVTEVSWHIQMVGFVAGSRVLFTQGALS